MLLFIGVVAPQYLGHHGLEGLLAVLKLLNCLQTAVIHLLLLI